MTTNTSKIVFTATFAILAVGMLMITTQTNQANALGDTLNIAEKDALPSSIKSYEVSNMRSSDSLSKISTNELSVDFKGKQYDLILIEDELLNNAVTTDNTENAVAYVGYVSDDPKSKVSIIISDNEIAGTIATSEKRISIEPLSFYGEEFSGDRQIIYDQTDIEFEFSFGDDASQPDRKTSTISKTTLENTSMIPLAFANSGHLIDTIIDTDDDYYDINTSNCATRLLTVVGSTNTIYGYQTDATINLVEFNCDESYLSASNLVGYRADLKNHWKNDSTNRDAVLGFIGHDVSGTGIGIAWEDTVTEDYWAYAITQLVDDSSGDYDASAYEQKILIAHEMGHIMDASHNNNYLPGTSDYSIMAGNVELSQSTFQDDFLAASSSLIDTKAHAALP